MLKTTKLIIGIFSIIMSVLIGIQSSIANLGILISGDVSGIFGIILSVFMLTAGIVVLATRKSPSGGIAAAVLYIIAGLSGACGVKNFPDLEIWLSLSFIFAAIIIIGNIIEKKKLKKKTAAENSAPAEETKEN